MPPLPPPPAYVGPGGGAGSALNVEVIAGVSVAVGVLLAVVIVVAVLFVKRWMEPGGGERWYTELVNSVFVVLRNLGFVFVLRIFFRNCFLLVCSCGQLLVQLFVPQNPCVFFYLFIHLFIH